MRRFSRVLALAFLITGALAAQSVVDRWAGVADTTDEGGTKREEKQTIEIRSEEGRLTGKTISRNGGGGISLQVQQDGARINLYGFLPLDGGEHLRWKLELKDGKLVGTFSALHDNPKKWIYDRTGAITLKKAPAASLTPVTK
ncbi:MAG TPA: hypothetical protein VHB50_07940 [Bryobacteraceae bacterium]|nr:hypothetical protein [Bryobacteraceae bacterium]